jgi:protein disulfide-isomerase A6
MKPAYDKLGEEYKDSSSVVIGDADCTASGKELCDANDVRGYPTIKYFTGETGPKGADYNGGRDYEALKAWVEENLEVKCLLDNTEGCSDKEKEFMEKWKAKGKEEVTSQLERLKGMSSGSMKPDLKKWLVQRMNILKQL